MAIFLGGCWTAWASAIGHPIDLTQPSRPTDGWGQAPIVGVTLSSVICHVGFSQSHGTSMAHPVPSTLIRRDQE